MYQLPLTNAFQTDYTILQVHDWELEAMRNVLLETQQVNNQQQFLKA